MIVILGLLLRFKMVVMLFVLTVLFLILGVELEVRIKMMTTTKSERTTRVIDFDQDASMEQKKREGYF